MSKRSGVTARILELISAEPGITGAAIAEHLDIPMINVRPLLTTYLESGQVSSVKVVGDRGTKINAYRMADCLPGEQPAAVPGGRPEAVFQRTVSASDAPRALDIPSFTNSPFASGERLPQAEPEQPKSDSPSPPLAPQASKDTATSAIALADDGHRVLKRAGLFSDGTAVLEFDHGAPVYLSARCADMLVTYLQDPWHHAMAAADAAAEVTP